MKDGKAVGQPPGSKGGSLSVKEAILGCTAFVLLLCTYIFVYGASYNSNSTTVIFTTLIYVILFPSFAYLPVHKKLISLHRPIPAEYGIRVLEILAIVLTIINITFFDMFGYRYDSQAFYFPLLLVACSLYIISGEALVKNKIVNRKIKNIDKKVTTRAILLFLIIVVGTLTLLDFVVFPELGANSFLILRFEWETIKLLFFCWFAVIFILPFLQGPEYRVGDYDSYKPSPLAKAIKSFSYFWIIAGPLLQYSMLIGN